MSSSVIALIGIAGTVIVAIVGFLSTASATKRTVAAATTNTVLALAAAREDRLWEKQAATYEETLAGLL